MTNMKSTITMMALGVGLLLASCRKSAIDQLNADESRIYVTNYDSTANFANYNTYSIADSVVVINGNSAGKQLNATDRAFIEAFKNAMQAKGFTLVNKSNSPDLGLQVSRIIQTSTGYISYPDYYGYWDPYYWGYPGYGYGNPYWNGVASYQIKEGMLSVDAVDLKNTGTGNKLKVVWNGLIRGSGIFDATTANSQVQQLFSQSPYLDNN